MSIAFPSFASADAIGSASPAQVVPTHSAGPEPDRASLQRSVQDLMGHFRELQHATRSEISQTRAAVEHRLDDLAAALHTDMRRLRSESHSEVETLGKDLFHCATALSHVQDRLTRLELAFNALAAQLPVQETPSAPPLNILPIRRTPLEPLSC